MNNSTTDYNYCIAVGKTDIGRKRKANEDNGAHFVTKNGLVSVVCDGMGGHVGGAIASETAITAINEFLNCQYFEDPREAIGLAIEAANKAIIDRTRVEPGLSGMGSTCVLLIVRDAKVYIGHVGDSRIYLIREKKITQLTKDHSFVQMLVDMGEITKEQAEHHPRKNEITNALGLPNMSPATIKSDPIIPQAGDCFLLCSDGLSGMVDDSNIEKIVSKQRELRTQDRANLLVQTANNNGGVDNITVELVEFTVTPGNVTSRKSGNKKRIILGITSLFLLVVIGCCALLLYKPTPKIRYTSWGSVSFEKQQTVFSIEYNQSDKRTIIAFKDKNDTINYPLNDESQIESNLNINRLGTKYILKFNEEYPTNTDSVFVRLSIDGKQFTYSVHLNEIEEEIPLIELQPKTLAAIPYKKNTDIATLTYISSKKYILLSVTNNDDIEISGTLDTDNINIEKAQIKTSPDNDTKRWTVYCTNKADIEISFVCEEKDNIRKKYTYVIPFVETVPIKTEKPISSCEIKQDTIKQDSIVHKTENVEYPEIENDSLITL